MSTYEYRPLFTGGTEIIDHWERCIDNHILSNGRWKRSWCICMYGIMMYICMIIDIHVRQIVVHQRVECILLSLRTTDNSYAAFR